MTDQQLIEKIRTCRPADLADGMDAIGLIGTGTMSSKMRPIRPGISMAGFAYTVKLVQTQRDVKVCRSFAEYKEELGRWCADTYTFFAAVDQGKCRDKTVVIDMGGFPGGIWGSENGLRAIKMGVAGVVIDGGCRDIYECNLEKVKAWCTAPTFNHVYGRLENGGVDVPIECAGVRVNPGDVVCGDDDGVLVIPRERAEEVLQFAVEVHEDDQKTRAKTYRDLGYEPDDTLGSAG